MKQKMWVESAGTKAVGTVQRADSRVLPEATERAARDRPLDVSSTDAVRWYWRPSAGAEYVLPAVPLLTGLTVVA